jgi:hypothetical protein
MTRTKLYWTVQIICWGIYVTYVTWGTFYYFYKLSAFESITSGFASFFLFIFGTHCYRFIVRDKDIEVLKWYEFLVYPVVGNIVIAFPLAVLTSFSLNFEQISPYSHYAIWWFFAFQFLEVFRFSMPWFILYHGIKFAEKAIKNERDKIDAQMQLKVAEFDNLRNQLNPHFLFNALNSIRSLTLSDPKMAREATTKLSDLLRISLTYRDLQDISFEEELMLVKDYLSLEKIRFEDRLNYQIEIEKGVLMVLVPPMALQLLAENAIKHGICKVKNGGDVIVFAHKKGESFVFGIRNTGNLVASESRINHRKGIGLENLKKRLWLNYGVENSFQISVENNVVTTEICIPLRMA